jgi:serine/threonine-protein kinase
MTACPQCGLEYAAGEVFCPNDGARLAPKHDSTGVPVGRSSDADPLIGQLLSGRYKIIRKIGEGGMGIVYEAEHVVIEKRVGLKVLREDFSRRADVVERFRQEAKSASKIGHEHIIDISDFGVTATGANYFVMELLHGHDLASELEKKGPLSARRTIQLALQCTRALGAAHKKGIVHRDMKPENIFLVQRASGEDFVKIVDFGIAKMSDIETDGQPGRKLTKTGMIFGTPEYMSPEQAGGKKLDHRVDIYAMGIILYELLTGRVPYVGDTFMGILTQHMFETPPPIALANPAAQVPPELERIVLKALAKNADDRYQSMEELGHDLTLALEGASSGTAPSLAPPPGTVTHHGYGADHTGDPRAPRIHVPVDTGMSAQRKNGAGLWMGLGALVVALGGGALYVLRSDGSAGAASPQTPIEATPSAHASSTLAPSAPPPSPQVPAEAPPPAPAVVQVSVQVDSEPSGAVVHVDGVEVCSGTPCRFNTERGKEVSVQADKPGYRSASQTLTPSADSSQITLKLSKKSSGRPRSSDGTHMEGDIKIPDAFGR